VIPEDIKEARKEVVIANKVEAMTETVAMDHMGDGETRIMEAVVVWEETQAGADVKLHKVGRATPATGIVVRVSKADKVVDTEADSRMMTGCMDKDSVVVILPAEAAVSGTVVRVSKVETIATKVEVWIKAGQETRVLSEAETGTGKTETGAVIREEIKASRIMEGADKDNKTGEEIEVENQEVLKVVTGTGKGIEISDRNMADNIKKIWDHGCRVNKAGAKATVDKEGLPIAEVLKEGLKVEKKKETEVIGMITDHTGAVFLTGKEVRGNKVVATWDGVAESLAKDMVMIKAS
jgi:hypothetical protein